MKKILVTGAAGFIGFHLVQRFLNEGFEVIGLDNINSYYDVNLKYARLAETGIYALDETVRSRGKNRIYKQIKFGERIYSSTNPNYSFIRLNLEDKAELEKIFEIEKFDYVINLAAQAGVRYSIENPDAYIQSNIVGFVNILEACRNHPVKHLIYSSSSSVYGANTKIPFSETDIVDNPISLYAATKKSNELMAYTYSHLYKVPTTGLRFFTVYGPWGRPDMAPILFANAIKNGDPIKVFNNGDMERDFTYIDDIIEFIRRLTPLSAINIYTKINDQHTEGSSIVENSLHSSDLEIHDTINTKLEINYNIFNVGNGSPVNLLTFIKTIEQAMDKETDKIMMPMQDGDVKRTWADIKKIEKVTGYKPETNIVVGIKRFTEWFIVYNSNKE